MTVVHSDESAPEPGTVLRAGFGVKVLLAALCLTLTGVCAAGAVTGVGPAAKLPGLQRYAAPGATPPPQAVVQGTTAARPREQAPITVSVIASGTPVPADHARDSGFGARAAAGEEKSRVGAGVTGRHQAVGDHDDRRDHGDHGGHSDHGDRVRNRLRDPLRGERGHGKDFTRRIFTSTERAADTGQPERLSRNPGRVSLES